MMSGRRAVTLQGQTFSVVLYTENTQYTQEVAVTCTLSCTSGSQGHLKYYMILQ